MLRFPPLLVVGLTGGIASGKSTVAAMLAELGAEVIDADRMGHQVLAPGEPGLAEVVWEFGAEYLTLRGELDRKALAAKVFREPAALAALNRITHPRIAERLRERLRELQASPPRDRIVVVEAAVLVEAGWAAEVDKIMVVAAQQSCQVGRLTRERGLAPEEAEARIRAQAPLSRRLRSADYVIHGDLPLADTRNQVRQVWHELRQLISSAAQPATAEKSSISHGVPPKPRRRPAA